MKPQTKKYVLALGIALISNTAFGADAGVKVAGYVDAQVYGNSNSTLTQGFTVNQGAVYFSKEMGSTSATVDIPFQVDTSAASGADFVIGRGQMQAYVTQKYDFGLKWKLGQFDTIYGFEVNDTADVIFSRQGLVYSAALPVVHAGLLVTYELMPNANLNVIVANPSDNNLLRQNNLQYGAQLTFSPENYRFAAGVLTGKDKTTDQTGTLADFLLGGTFGTFAADAEVALKKPAVSGAKTGLGLLGNFVYGFNETVGAGVRVEYGKDLAPATLKTGYTATGEKQFMLTVGPQFNMSKDMKVKLDYSFLSDSPASGDALKNHAYTLAAVYKF